MATTSKRCMNIKKPACLTYPNFLTNKYQIINLQFYKEIYTNSKTKIYLETNFVVNKIEKSTLAWIIIETTIKENTSFSEKQKHYNLDWAGKMLPQLTFVLYICKAICYRLQ